MIRALMFLPLSMAVASIASPGVACEKSFALQKSAPPLPSGTVVFQAGSGNTAELYLFDTISHKQTNLTKTWPLIYTPVNGHISADGQNVVFTAVSCPGMTKRDYSCTQQTSARTDIYLWHAGSSALIGLTTGLPNSRYEDVIFTPDDSGVLLKQNGQIASYSMDYTNPNAPKLGAARTLPSLPPGDQIYMEAPGGTAFETIAVNMCSADNSDPAPIGATSVLFSNDNTGNYLPFLADLSTGDIWSLAKIGVGRGVVSVLGMSFTSTRLTPH
jgi:Tol biopolymer transport system component